MMPNPMNRNPKNDMIGPMTMRRVLKMSGLNPLASDEPAPSINRKPIIIANPAMPIRMKFILISGNFALSSII